jgi:hypothetical protein
MQNERILQSDEYLAPASRMRLYRDDGTPERDIMLYQILIRTTAAPPPEPGTTEREDISASDTATDDTPAERDNPAAERDAKITPLGYGGACGNVPIFSDRDHARAYYGQFQKTREYNIVERLANLAIIQSETQL